jgi:hypothetical protein
MSGMPVGLMEAGASEAHDLRTSRRETMWQLHAAFRLGDYRTSELDVTPAVGITLIVAVVGLIIQTGL